ncbi:MAG TPA: CRTAC1 family protein, partial [Acidobacteriota bacterium]|nr:CRTAC1 family protein [Acidobacteriota bacterium]
EREPYNASAHYNLATALTRAGRAEEGRREMEEFRRLQDLFGSTTVGLQYLEQGRFAEAIPHIPDRFLPVSDFAQPAPIEVRFREVAENVGLNFVHSGPGKAPLSAESLQELEENIVPFVGSGAAFADFNRDGWLDLFMADAVPEASGRLYRNDKGNFIDVTEQSGVQFEGPTMQALWGDYDNDGYPDLYLLNYGRNRLYHNLQNGSFEDVTDRAGVGGENSWSMTGAFVDYDHDGDLDILIGNFSEPSRIVSFPVKIPDQLPGAPNVLYQNDGNGSFTDTSQSSGLAAGQRRTTALFPSDFDNSRDVDFYVVHEGTGNQLFSNRRDRTFEDIASTAGLVGGGTGIGGAVADFNHDGWMDLALPSLRPNNSLMVENRGNNNYQRVSLLEDLKSLTSSGFQSIQFLDYDNDGDLDLLLISSVIFSAAGEQQNFFLLENRNGRFHDVSEKTGLSQYRGLPVRGVAVVDFDNDGDLDILVTLNGKKPLLLENDGGNKNNWIQVAVRGVNSNHSGIGVKAELKSGRLYQKAELTGGHGFLSHASPFLHFGLGQHDRVDVIRLLWPNGVLQSEIDHPVNQKIEIAELDRKGTSCPILYVWNGETYVFQTDFLGGSAYGSLLKPGVYNYPDTDEYIKLNPDDVADQDGFVSISMNNQLEEVILFDQVELLVVDHPEETAVFPDEKLLPGPPYQPFRLFTVSNLRSPRSAVDDTGADVLTEILEIDRHYPENFEKRPFKGYSNLHHLQLDLGPVGDRSSVLLLHAWIDYADSSSNLAASQAEIDLIPPYLQVRDKEGEWVTVIERMGFPAGLPKTMTVDLDGVFLSDSREIRIVTNMNIYWDQVLVGDCSFSTPSRVLRLPVAQAELGFKGFPMHYSPDGRSPKIYDYDRASPTAEWKVHVGAYTRYGDVRPLLTEKDDLFVVTRSGDEIRISFDVSDLPPLPEGWRRDYIVYADGFGKDMDPNSAAPHFVGPLPFHGMPSFPYSEGESYVSSPERREYLEKWNTRIVEEAVPSLEEALNVFSLEKAANLKRRTTGE